MNRDRNIILTALSIGQVSSINAIKSCTCPGIVDTRLWASVNFQPWICKTTNLPKNKQTNKTCFNIKGCLPGFVLKKRKKAPLGMEHYHKLIDCINCCSKKLICFNWHIENVHMWNFRYRILQCNKYIFIKQYFYRQLWDLKAVFSWLMILLLLLLFLFFVELSSLGCHKIHQQGFW